MIETEVLERALAQATSRGAQFAEVFVEDRRIRGARFDDGRIEELSSGRSIGAGIRAMAGDSTGFAHTTDLSEQGLLRAAKAAADAARDGDGDITEIALEQRPVNNPNPVEIRPISVEKAKKVELLRTADNAARSQGAQIVQVAAGYGDVRRRIQIANSRGLLVNDDQTRTRFAVSCVAAGDAGMQTGMESIGHTMGFELFDRYDVAELSEIAAQRAITKLHARPAPSGMLTCVIGKGGGGVLFHEACGHGLEADHVHKQATVFADRIGQRVASDLVTLIDDGTMSGEWGALGIDDEGHPTQRNVLIEDGILVDYLWDDLRGTRSGYKSTGNGRRQSYKHLPMVRMTNTFVANGETNPHDIIASTDSGIYVAKLGGGQVNTVSGDFVFGMREAYLIENGQITEPIREGNLIGNGPEVLMSIDAVGNDFAMGSPGTCGKDGQGVPVGDGTPTLRVTGMTVGGTAQ